MNTKFEIQDHEDHTSAYYLGKDRPNSDTEVAARRAIARHLGVDSRSLLFIGTLRRGDFYKGTEQYGWAFMPRH